MRLQTTMLEKGLGESSLSHLAYRSTKDYKFESSYDNVTWYLEFSGTLADARSVSCASIPIVYHPGTYAGRYFRFTAISHYGQSASLQYFNFTQKTSS